MGMRWIHFRCAATVPELDNRGSYEGLTGAEKTFVTRVSIRRLVRLMCQSVKDVAVGYLSNI